MNEMIEALKDIARRAEETQIHQEDAKARLIDPNLAREYTEWREAVASDKHREYRLRTLLCDALVIIDAHRRHTGGEGDLVAHEIRQMGVDYGPNQPNREKNAITQLTNQCDQANEQVRLHENEINRQASEIDRLTKLLKVESADKNGLHNEVVGLREQISIAVLERDDARDELAKLQEELKRQRSFEESQDNEIDRLTKLVVGLRDRIESLLQELTNRPSLPDMVKEMNALREEVANHQASQIDNEALCEEIKRFQLANLQQLLASKESDITLLKTTNHERQVELERWQQMVGQRNQKIEELFQERDELAAKLKERETENERWNKIGDLANGKIEQTQRERDDLAEKLKGCQDRKSKLAEEVEQQQQQITQLGNQLHEERKTLGNRNRELMAERKTLFAWGKKIEELTGYNTALESRNRQLAEQLQQRIEQCDRMTLAHRERQAEVNSLQDRIENMKRQRDFWFHRAVS